MSSKSPVTNDKEKILPSGQANDQEGSRSNSDINSGLKPGSKQDKMKEEKSSEKYGNKMSKKDKKEVAKVSKLVQKKLESFINVEQRENRFDVGGIYRTTERMHRYDVAYKMMEEDMEATSPRAKKSHTTDERHHRKSEKTTAKIDPKLEATSRRVTLNCEVDRLTDSVNQIFESLPVDKLSKIHRYRPDHRLQPSTENGMVHNYSRHLGAALHQQDYISFYMREGLHCGNPDKSERMKRLKKKDDQEDDSSSSSVNSRTTSEDTSRTKHKQQPDSTHTIASTSAKEKKDGKKDGKGNQQRKSAKENFGKNKKSDKRKEYPVPDLVELCKKLDQIGVTNSDSADEKDCCHSNSMETCPKKTEGK